MKFSLGFIAADLNLGSFSSSHLRVSILIASSGLVPINAGMLPTAIALADSPTRIPPRRAILEHLDLSMVY